MEDSEQPLDKSMDEIPGNAEGGSVPSTETEKLLTDESVEQAAAAASLDTASGHLHLQGILARLRKAYDQFPCLLYTPGVQVVDTHEIACDDSLFDCCNEATELLPCMCGALCATPCFLCCFYSLNRGRAGLGSYDDAFLTIVPVPLIMAVLAGWFAAHAVVFFTEDNI